MRKFIFFIVFTLMIVFGTYPEASASENGKIIFEKYCAKCHGKDGSVSEYGKSIKPVSAKDLRTNKLFISPKEILIIIKYGIYGREMKGWSDILSPNDIKDVAEYVRTFTYKPKPEEGEKTFKLRCASCHARDGSAKKIFEAPDLDMSPLGERELARTIRYGRYNTMMFPKDALLSNIEIANVVSYLMSIKK
ncbi:MAG: c-type cytochrome [Deltaproteobacteria bacterium]|nr:c-type cytochrome [Deltaproteobacteria bacterium]